MSTPTTMKPSTPTAKSSSKAAKHSKIVTITLKPTLLARFPTDTPSRKPSLSQTSSKPAATPLINPPTIESADATSETTGTPLTASTPTATDSNSLAPPAADGAKRKGGPGTKAGVKRTAAQIADDNEKGKAKGKPGPKKKPRLADGSIDRASDPTLKKGPIPSVAPANAHKLGPKANTGAINAGLRALDRSGKPCRKWERKGFQLKSFTGINWAVGSWNAPIRDSSTFSGDVKSDTSGSSEIKPNVESSIGPSERSASGDAAGRSNGVGSSPAPQVAVES